MAALMLAPLLLGAAGKAAAELPRLPTSIAELESSCQQQLEQSRQQFNQLQEGQAGTDAAAVLANYHELEILIDLGAGQASLLSNVHPDPELRQTAEKCYQQYVALATEIGTSRPVYDALSALPMDTMAADTRRYLELALRGFRRSGVDRDEATRARVRELGRELAAIGQEFGRNIREDVRHLEASAEQLEGLPEDFLASHPPGEDGLIRISTDYPDYFPVMRYAIDDELRKRFQVLFLNRGWPGNEEVLMQMLQRRHELAQLLGYRHYADYVTADKMTGSAQTVADFIQRVLELAQPRGETDARLLMEQLRATDPDARQIGSWQRSYLQELVSREQFQLDTRQLRRYFPYRQVLEGMLSLASELFEIEIRPIANPVVWHPSVEAYEIVEQGEVLGRFYLDMHPREGKYKHAAHFGLVSGVRGRQLPVSALICNFPAGNGLMEHQNVTTLFHEFGHLLHHILGGHQRWSSLSGINTEWDFVEAPSQMLEEWVWDKRSLKRFARTVEGEVIPDSLIQSLQASRDFGRGLWVQNQLFYASLSLGYHNRNPEFSPKRLMLTLQHRYAPYEYPEDTHFYASFGHLSGYSALYYTYMWSLVIAEDLFSRFSSEGLFNPQVARAYRRSVLEPGGLKPAAQLIEDFLGRPYQFTAFARRLNQP